ncbi:hypothetical protein SynBIOSU31_01204 [Synechococcus sp. BIOS-U3-1]|nr:hypothetical protein SynBIOSU31_01204 [Synechococcus sp. BIOS-U3-1]
MGCSSTVSVLAVEEQRRKPARGLTIDAIIHTSASSDQKSCESQRLQKETIKV